MKSISPEYTIRSFEESDMPLLGDLYQAVTARDNAVFWWVGEPPNWHNVYCAFENNRMIGKGQIEVTSTIHPQQPEEYKHTIYINIKTVPEREVDTALLEALYQPLLSRAIELQKTLSTTHETMLCIGNHSSETANISFFKDKGYSYLQSLFHMERNLLQPLPGLTLPSELQFDYWQMATTAEEQQYLNIDAEIWPEAPIGSNKLAENKKQPLWTAMVVREYQTMIGGLMAWQEEDEGIIEDVWVREPWRRRGIARYLLVEGLKYLQSHSLEKASLTVLTDNHSALSLYESAGFQIMNEEVRYGIVLG
ncbi:GNAT family N-acetyltransferase [Paenibacillus shenyangensis]|uniref:GNAT family N-acetyltransferase n=1 Tax=Paenibacillus sp. A9 TaxID=1284352 RepID=UPI0003812BBF|nr:GNAT family N-acetyltransferase [Paenibacillus sp. A9]